MTDDRRLGRELRRLGEADWQPPVGGAAAAVRSARRRTGATVAGLAAAVTAVALAVPVALGGGTTAAPLPPSSAEPTQRTEPSVAPSTVPAPPPAEPSRSAPLSVEPSPPPASPAPPPAEPSASAPPSVEPGPPPASPAPVPREPSSSFPEHALAAQGETFVAVVVAVAREGDDPRVAQAVVDLAAVGYEAGVGDAACTQGVYEGLGLDPAVSYTTVDVLFRTREEAQQFVDAFVPGVVGTVEVQTYCVD